MDELLSKLEYLAYKGRYSIYHNLDETIVRTYKADGSQRKFVGNSLEEALLKAIESYSL